MTYTEKELDQFLHGISLSLLSKKSAQHWRYDEETAKEIEWLEALERKVRADKADRKTEPTAYADGYADGQRDERERWERMADRKTENSSEIPNNCETCKWGERYRQGYDITMMDDECGGCCSWNSKWTPKTEPTISKMEQVEEPQEVCDRPQKDCENCWKELHCRAKDDPQTDCPWK